MKKTKTSLRTGFLTTILICWLVPIFIVVALAGVLLNENYRQSVQQEIDSSAANALRLVQMRFEDAIDDSKAVSYEGVVRDAYRTWLQNGDSAALYGSVSDYLSQSFTRGEIYQAVFIYFWNVDASAYVLSDGTTSFGLLRQCRQCAPRIAQEMTDADTDIRCLMIDGQMYMARNLLDSTFKPYASVVMLLQPSSLFLPLDSVNRVGNLQYSLDSYRFSIGGDGSLTETAEQTGNVHYQVKTQGHTIGFSADREEYDIFGENPWMRWAIGFVAALVLPLSAVTIALFYRHVTRPMEVLGQAYQLVKSGERGYEIDQKAPNTEFEKLYDQFDAMSAELQRQFERAYLEQQATQQANIKALQSQINPHFLNNTLEIINWEARMADNERVSAMIESLSTMLKAALDRDGRTKIPLSEELGYVDAYLYIIRERLGEGFRVHKDIDESILPLPVPRLVLQPLVENAVEHDITANRGGDLWVRAYRQADKVGLEVEHDGVLTPEDKQRIASLLAQSSQQTVPGGQVGLRNVSQRLNLIYGSEGTLILDETRAGTILARVSIPAGA